MNRVVVTGMGCVTPMGTGMAAFQQNLFHGTQGFHEIAGVAPGDLRFHRTAQVPDFNPALFLTAQQIQISERSAQFALVAAQEAVRNSGFLETQDPSEVAIVFGCSAGGRSAEEPETAKLYRDGARVHPLTVPRVMTSAGTSLVAIEHGITGPAYTVSTACASATHAIGQAFHMVRSGAVQAAVTGGHDAPLTYGFLKAWDSLRVVSPTQCRPFSADRDGMTLGEGSAMLVLETLQAALARGAHIHAEIVGFGMSADAHHMTQAQPQGPAAAMFRAVRDTGDTRARVDHINAHGTGTAVNDSVEAASIHSLFGDATSNIAVTSTKSMHGHAMGASGALEALATVLTLREGIVPATSGVTTTDPALQLDIVIGQARTADIRLALSNSFAFGGLNAVLALRRFDG